MIILKGDIVQLHDGREGEVTEIWGVVRTFLRVSLEDRCHIIVFETDVAAILQRYTERETKRGKADGQKKVHQYRN